MFYDSVTKRVRNSYGYSRDSVGFGTSRHATVPNFATTCNNLFGNTAIIPLFHKGPESHELTRIDKYLDSWLNRTQFVMVLADSHSQ